MKVTKEFVLAGKAIFTVELEEKFRQQYDLKPHYTFRVNFKKADKGFPDTYFVKLLTGPENTKDYSYLGVLEPESGKVRCTAKSCLREDSIPVLLLNRALVKVWTDTVSELEAAGFKLHHEGRCGKCGRVLTVPESVETGIGPECSGRGRKKRTKTPVVEVPDPELDEDDPRNEDPDPQPQFWGGGRWLGQAQSL